MRFGIVNSRMQSKPQKIDVSWQFFIEKYLKKHLLINSDPQNLAELNQNKHTEGFIFCDFAPKSTKSAKNVRTISGICLDIDDATDTQIKAGLEYLLPYEYYLYTTYKHGAPVLPPNKRTRIRVVLPFKDPIDPKYWRHIWQTVYDRTKQIADPQCKDFNRLYYFPATYDLAISYTYHNNTTTFYTPDLREIPTSAPTPSELHKALNIYQRIPKELKATLKALKAAQPYAEPGHRHQTNLDVTLYLAKHTYQNPATADEIAALFGPSINVMTAQDPTTPAVQDVITAYDGAVAKYRAQQYAHTEQYTEDELQNIAGTQGWLPQDLTDRWIIQKDRAYYFLDHDGRYQGPHTQQELYVSAHQILKRAPVKFYTITPRGRREKPLPEVILAHGQCAKRIHATFSQDYTTYDPITKTIHEAVTPIRRSLQEQGPRFDADFDKYLKILGGRNYNKLQDWIACVPDTRRLLCALYISGVPGSFKTGLALSLAKLWTEGSPTLFENILGGFNEELVNCPLILADEALPQRWNKQPITAVLRNLISTQQRTLTRKYLPPSTLVGAVRLILTANNDFLLRSDGVRSSDDLTAIAQRFLFVRAPHEATDFIESLPKATINAWIAHNIARHSLYLYQTREVAHGQRFWVDGDISDMSRLLLTTDEYSELVLRWLAEYLQNPAPIDTQRTGLIRLDNSALLVNSNIVVKNWKLYFSDLRAEPDPVRIGAALKALALDDGERRQLRYDGRRIRYYVIDPENLYAWADSTDLIDREEIEIALGLRQREACAVTEDLGSVRTKQRKGA